MGVQGQLLALLPAKLLQVNLAWHLQAGAHGIAHHQFALLCAVARAMTQLIDEALGRQHDDRWEQWVIAALKTLHARSMQTSVARCMNAAGRSQPHTRVVTVKKTQEV
jgi:hypothetical protein